MNNRKRFMGNSFYRGLETLSDMATSRRMPWDRLESWGELAFVAAGLLWIGFIGISVYERRVLMDLHQYIWLTEILLPMGWLSAYIGLLGFYPRVAEAAPRLSRASLSLVVIGIVSVLVNRGGAVVVGFLTGSPFWEVTTGLEPLYAVVMATTFLGFLLYGVASVRTRVPSRTVGGLFLVPAALLSTHVALLFLDGLPNPIAFEFGTIALVMIALAYVLRFETPTTSPTEVSQKSTN